MSRNGGARILVVDDVPENVRLLEAVLASRGYDVVSATDGRTALELAESAKPELVLLDVVMPELDGYAVCRTLREREETAVLPVIMLTASLGPEKTKAIEAGADDFIAKPFNHDELFARVRSLLRIKRYHDTIKAQAGELLELNQTLEERVRTQVEELERFGRLQRFLSPQLAHEHPVRAPKRGVSQRLEMHQTFRSIVEAIQISMIHSIITHANYPDQYGLPQWENRVDIVLDHPVSPCIACIFLFCAPVRLPCACRAPAVRPACRFRAIRPLT